MTKRFWREIGFDQDNILYEDAPATPTKTQCSLATWSNRSRRTLAARHLGDAYASFHRRLPASRLSGDPYPVNYRTNGRYGV